MSQINASIVICTAASSLLLLLILLRLKINGQLPLLAMTRRWVTMPATTSTGVLALVAAVATSAFVATFEPETGTRAPENASASAPPAHTAFDTDEDLAALRSYASSMDAPHASAPNEPLPGVDEMISQLKARLDENPGDVKGWKMLGWSYQNIGQVAEASRAYEAALKLAPADAEITAALAAVKSAAAEAVKR